jgi:hypothetical protein
VQPDLFTYTALGQALGQYRQGEAVQHLVARMADSNVQVSAARPVTYNREKELRIVTWISGGRSLTRPFRDARRFPSTRWYGATRTTFGCGICPSFKGHSLSPLPNLNVTIRNLLRRCTRVGRAAA